MSVSSRDGQDLCPSKSTMSSIGAPFIHRQRPTKFLGPLPHSPRLQTNAAHFQAVHQFSLTETHALFCHPGHAQPSGPQSKKDGANFSGLLTGRVWVLRPRDVQHPTFEFYHVPGQTVLTALPHTVLISRSSSRACEDHFASITFRSFFSSSTVRKHTRLLSSQHVSAPDIDVVGRGRIGQFVVFRRNRYDRSACGKTELVLTICTLPNTAYR